MCNYFQCWLQLLTEFCLRNSIRESEKFQSQLRPIYHQAEVLQCWSMLSDVSFAEVVTGRFCALADYQYAFASRGTDRGLLINLLKSASEFYSFVNTMSCFSSAKRRCYLRAICEILLKPSLQIVRADSESFRNCVLNLLTDIESFALSCEDSSVKNHEIKLLIDEALILISANAEAVEVYFVVFEEWLESSKDSPILIHLINRMSQSYNLAQETNKKFSCLLELCVDVYFQTEREIRAENNASKNELFPSLSEVNLFLNLKRFHFF